MQVAETCCAMGTDTAYHHDAQAQVTQRAIMPLKLKLIRLGEAHPIMPLPHCHL